MCPAVRTGTRWSERTLGRQYGTGGVPVRQYGQVIEGYPPDEYLQWDETTHITSLWVGVRKERLVFILVRGLSS